jgi:hypothetical protein
MKTKIMATYVSIGLLVLGLCLFGSKSRPESHKIVNTKSAVQKYIQAKDSVRLQKEALFLKYKNAKTDTDKKSVIAESRHLFIKSLTVELFPYWYGTTWNFYGYGDTPRVNAVACGYFVALLLRDAGAKVDVHDLAEGTSGAMIKKLVAPAYIKKYRNVDYGLFFDAVKKDGDGLYIVGLDNHTGFLLCEKQVLYFIESVPGDVVRRRPAGESGWLTGSNFRMTGKISADPAFLRKWLTGEKF